MSKGNHLVGYSKKIQIALNMMRKLKMSLPITTKKIIVKKMNMKAKKTFKMMMVQWKTIISNHQIITKIVGRIKL